MGAQTERAALDRLVREVQQATKDWPERPAPLAQALAAAETANDTGVEIAAAFEDLTIAWDAVHPASPPDVSSLERDRPPEEF